MVLCIQDNEGDAFCVCKLLVQMKKNLIYMHHIQPMHNNRSNKPEESICLTFRLALVRIIIRANHLFI